MNFSVKRIFFIIVSFIIITGFDFSKNTVLLSEIYDGGPPKDGIPALSDPTFITDVELTYLKSKDRVLGIEINGDAMAYPIRILNWHELVNDHVGGRNILLSYCPLCGTGMAFDSTINGERVIFGVSGKLYNSDVLFYDKKTLSLWSQIKKEAVTGVMSGTKLQLLPLEHTTWEAWKAKYPATKLLSNKTGYARDYKSDPYKGYDLNETLYFPVKNKDLRLLNKDWILGVIVNGEAKAYPFSILKNEQNRIKDIVGGRTVYVHYDPLGNSAIVKDAKEKIIPSIQGYWFAWVTFYPETRIFGFGSVKNNMKKNEKMKHRESK